MGSPEEADSWAFRIGACPLRAVGLALRALPLIVRTLFRPLARIVGRLFLFFLILLPCRRFALRAPRLEVRDILIVLPLALCRIGLGLRRRRCSLGIVLRILIRLVAQTLLVLTVRRLRRVLARRSLRVVERLLSANCGAVPRVCLRIEPTLLGMRFQRDPPHHMVAMALEALRESQAIAHEDRMLAALNARLGLCLNTPIDGRGVR